MDTCSSNSSLYGGGIPVWARANEVTRFTVLLLLTILLGQVAIAAPAGYAIVNQATGSYIDNDSGQQIHFSSNTAQVTVGELYLFTLNQSQQLSGAAGQTVTFSHQLTNTGNVADRYLLSIAAPAGDGNPPLNNPTLYHDLNQNGVFDVGEPAIAQSPDMAPGKTLFLIAQGTIPPNASSAEIYSLQLTAESIFSAGATAVNIDTARVNSPQDYRLVKTNFPSCSVPVSGGDTIDYEVIAENIGAGTPLGLPVTIDGIPLTDGFLLSDPIPANTYFPAGQAIGRTGVSGIPVVQLIGDFNSERWIRYGNWDGSEPVAKVGTFIRSADFVPGQTASFAFEVVANTNITEGTLVVNKAELVDATVSSQPFTTNEVCNTFSAGAEAQVRFVAPADTLRQTGQTPDFSQDDDFEDVEVFHLEESLSNYDVIRDGVYVELESTWFNGSGAVREDSSGSIVIELSSALTGDTLRIVVVETGPNTGVFRSLHPVALSLTRQGNGAVCPDTAPYDPAYDASVSQCVLQSAPGDDIRISIFDGGVAKELSDAALVDPFGIVFDSATGRSVSGATVVIRNPDGTVATDPDTGLPFAAQVTGADGYYSYPRMYPGDYYLDVSPPLGYRFPSIADPQSLPSTYTVLDASYGRDGPLGTPNSGVFTMLEGDPPLIVDIPLDPAPLNEGAITLDKDVDSPEIEPGGLANYTVQVRNNSNFDFPTVVIEDTIPFGFRYVEESTVLDGAPVADPSGAPGPVLRFTLNNLAANAAATVEYSLRATAGAVDGDGINTAFATVQDISGADVARSNQARVRVKLSRTGVLSDRAFVFGKIFVDTDCNDIQVGEWPIGGVKLVMEDGTWVVSDENGQYSLYGLRPGQHVIKIDPLTVPDGIRFKPIDNRHMAEPDSRWVDLLAGEYHRADFAAACPEPAVAGEVYEQIKQRNRSINGEWMLEEAERFNPGNVVRQTDIQRSRNSDGDVSRGVLTQQGGNLLGEYAATAGRRTDIPPALLPDRQPEADIVRLQKRETTEKMAGAVTREQAEAGTWLWPESEYSTDGRFVAVVRPGVQPVLYVNDEPVSHTQLGEQIVNQSARAQVVAWYGVELDKAENSLEVRAVDNFGNHRVLATGVFKKPAEAVEIRLSPHESALSADGGRSMLPVSVQVLDRNGYPARGIYFVTLEATDGIWYEADIQDSVPGQQIRLIEGAATVHLRSSEYRGKVRLRATANHLSGESEVDFVAPMRDLLATGLVDVSVRDRSVDSNGRAPSSISDPVIGNAADAQVAMYANGRIRGDMHLTIAYDSEKDPDQDLLRDIDPNAYYPIQGDASVRGYDAQSRSKLHLRLEKNRNYLQWGDFVTDSYDDHQNLARVQRTLTGARVVLDNGMSRLELFGAEQHDRRKTEELSGNGTALLYRLAGAPVVKNSELVELVVRDRDNTGLVIEARPLTRFGEYTLDHLSGLLRLSEAVPRFDERGNLVSIRVSYDVEGNGEDYLFGGLRFSQKFGSNIVAGLSYTDDRHRTDGFELLGAFVNVELGEDSRLTFSGADMSHIDGSSNGRGYRLDFEQNWGETGRTLATWARADSGFTNGSSVAAGREELRVSHSQRLLSHTNATLEVIDSRSINSDEKRRAAGVFIDISPGLGGTVFRLGGRSIEQRTTAHEDRFSTALLGIGKPLNLFGRTLTVDAEYEQDTQSSDKRRIALNGDWNLHDKLGVYGRYELINSLGGITSLAPGKERSTLSFGVRSDFLPSTQSYWEYRLRGAQHGRDIESAGGIRGTYEIKPGLSLAPSLEIIDVRAGNASDSIAASLGYKNLSRVNSRSLARLEYRDNQASDYYGFLGTYVARVTENWSSFIREDLRYEFPDDDDRTVDHTLTLGMTRRPRISNKYHLLFMYQWIEDESGSSPADRSVHLISTHHNYQFNDAMTLSARAGYKFEKHGLSDTHTFDSKAWLTDVRLLFDLNRRWDLDIHGGVLGTDGTGELRRSLGIGANFLVRRNLRLGVGYNWLGFKDQDLDAEGYNAQGVVLRMQYKFDEDLFGWLTGESSEQGE